MNTTIILGDFNAFSPHDSLFYTRTGIRDSMFSQQQNNSKLRNLNSRGDIDYQVVSTLLQSGFLDGYSLFNKTFETS
ncbi:hypothetical protein, partial [Niabella ginsengisoli]